MKTLQLICECGDVLDCEEIDYRKKPNQPNLPAEPIKVTFICLGCGIEYSVTRCAI